MADWQSRRSMNTTKDHEDFEEEDVWCFVNDHHHQQQQQESCEDSSPHQMRRLKSTTSTTVAPRMIRRAHAHEANNKGHVVQQSSAPVNIPDWSKIYGNNYKKANFLGSSSRNGSWVVGHDHQNHGHCLGDGDDDDGDDDDNNEDDMVPPHEWLAKKLARSQISSFSVCEGIGRTLKGRDLSKVRNAILTKTGFLE